MDITVNSNCRGFVFSRGIGHGRNQIINQIVRSPTENVVVGSLNLYCQMGNRIGKFQGDKQFFPCLEPLKPFLGSLVYVSSTVQQKATSEASISLLNELGEDLVIVGLAQATIHRKNFDWFARSVETKGFQVVSEIWPGMGHNAILEQRKQFF